MRVDLWIAIDESGSGGIALTREDALGAVPGTPRVAVARLSVWALCGAMVRASVLPVRFSLEHRTGGAARQEVRQW